MEAESEQKINSKSAKAMDDVIEIIFFLIGCNFRLGMHAKSALCITGNFPELSSSCAAIGKKALIYQR